jgi:hypothetical protein
MDQDYLFFLQNKEKSRVTINTAKSSHSIYTTIKQYEDTSMLFDAVKKANFKLLKENNITLIAPINNAFINSSSADDISIKNHIIDISIRPENFKELPPMVVSALDGKSIILDAKDNKSYVKWVKSSHTKYSQDLIEIAQVEGIIFCSNGIIILINKIIK